MIIHHLFTPREAKLLPETYAEEGKILEYLLTR
jgi:hypothetical protein